MRVVVLNFESDMFLKDGIIKRHIECGETPVIIMGRDTEAVKLSHILGAEKCVFYKRQGGIFISDKGRIFKIKEITYEKMLSICETEAVKEARRLSVEIEIRSLSGDQPPSVIRGYVSHT